MSMLYRSLTSALALSLALASVAHAAQDDIDKVLGSVQVAAGQQAGDVGTVDGAVRIGAGAGVRKVHTVNGAIDTGDRVTAQALSTVNGAIVLGRDGHISGDVSAVNGGIDLGSGGEIDGRVSNVDGRIRVAAAHVAGGIATVAGDIEIGAGARIEGGIRVEKCNTGRLGWFNHCRKPRVVIGPGAVVQGTLDFRRQVDLYVSDSAQVGPIKGATPQRFSGDHP
ncbi:MAG: hypothetical protein KGJ55_12340 [Gammaproteobacteria bacterium]|nr:hypothetical protein [Gammaproteobacteria bacterium]